MGKKIDKSNNISLKFSNNGHSKYKIENNTNGLDIDLDWIDKLEEAVSYIDNIFEAPKRFIVNEEVILDIEKTKKVTIESIKHLSKHTNFISEYNEEDDFIKPSKLLNVLKEETFNTYENRFIYTLVDLMEGFVRRLETKIQGLKFEKLNNLDYNLKTNIKAEKIDCRLQINTYEKINLDDNADRISNIKSHILSWQNSLMYKSLKKERAVKVKHPIKRTNVILKNPNFQIAIKLWDYLYNYTERLNNENKQSKNDKIAMEEKLKIIIDRSFLINYLIMKNENKKQNITEDVYKDNIKDIAYQSLNQSIDLLMFSDGRITLDDIIEVITDKYYELKKLKGINNEEIENKIKTSIKEIIDKMDNSFFEIERDVKYEEE